MRLDLSLLRGIPSGILPKEISSTQIIKGGLNNRNILINNSYLLKEYLHRDEKNDPVKLRYSREKSAFTQLSNHDFIPKLFKTYEVNSSFFLTRAWVEGTVINLSTLEESINNLVSTLSALHHYQYSTHSDYYYFDVIERYIREYHNFLNSQEWSFPEVVVIDSFYKNKSAILEQLQLKKNVGRIHGDLVFSNIIKSGKKCFLIDWEYSTIGEPIIDLAYLITQNSIPATIEKRLLERYMTENNLEIDLETLSLYKDLMNLMSGLWYALQVFRLQNNFQVHGETGISSKKFQELAIRIFKSLEI